MGKQPKRGGPGTEYKEKPPEEKKDGTIVKQWQRMPTVLLNEWAQKEKRPKPQYSGLRPFEKGKCRMKVVLPDPKDAAKSLEFEPNRDAETPFVGREDAAMVALLRLCGTLPLERKLPDGYRETWLEAIASTAPTKDSGKAKAKAKAKASSAPSADAAPAEAAKPTPEPREGAVVDGKALAEKQRQEAEAERSRATEEERLAREVKEDENRGVCFEWQRTGNCRRNECRFAHPGPQDASTACTPAAAEATRGAGSSTWAPPASGPLGAMREHMSRAEWEKETREARAAKAQARNRKQAFAEMRRLANLEAPALLARRMRLQISNALGLTAEYEEALRRREDGLLETLTDVQAGALRACTDDWGFAPDAVERALTAVMAEKSASIEEEGPAVLAEHLRVWLCLHLPEEELPEAFAAGRGQFEAKVGVNQHRLERTSQEHRQEVTPEAEAEGEFFQWLAEGLQTALEDGASAESLCSCVEVLLRPADASDAPPDEESETEALQGASDLLLADGIPEDFVSELRARWEAVLSLRRSAQASKTELAAEALSEAPTTAGAGDDEGRSASDETVGATSMDSVEAGAAPRPRRNARNDAGRAWARRLWFGWAAKSAAAARDAQAWRQSERGRKMQKAREALPAAKVQQELWGHLEAQQVLLVHGETGSGKTTQVGQFLLDQPTEGTPRIVVTQPRRFAAISVARRVAEERGERVGEGAVGYIVRGETRMQADRCQLLFCTVGVLLRRLVADGAEAMFGPDSMTHLVLDEVHERSMEMDFLLTLLRHQLPHRKGLRVLLMSATMDVAALGRIFPKKPPVLQIPGRTFPVEVLHLEEVEDLLGKYETTAWSRMQRPTSHKTAPAKAVAESWDDEVPDAWDAADELAERVEAGREGATSGRGDRTEGCTRRRHSGPGNGDRGCPATDAGDLSLLRPPGPVDYDFVADFVVGLIRGDFQKDAAQKNWPTDGAILMFMAGAGEISRTIDMLERKGGPKLLRAIPLHGSLSAEQQRRCFEVTPKGAPRKVVVATNVAETSVTLPDVTVVIDTCRERRLTRDHDLSKLAPALLERFCARDSLQQRRGRAGRTQRGVCFRLIPRSLFDKLPGGTAPEMEVLPLETLALQVRAAGFDPSSFLQLAPSPPSPDAVGSAEELLQTLGALRREERKGADPGERLTALGRHLAALPCDARVGRLVVLGAFLGCASAACGVAAWLAVRSPLVKPWAEGQEAKRDALRRKALGRQGGGKSDHCFWVALIEAYLAAGSRRHFCSDLGLSFERMAEVEASRLQLLRGLRSLGFAEGESEVNAGDWRVVRAAVVAGLYPFVAHVQRPPPKYAEGIGGAVRLDDNARELRYFVRGVEEASKQAGGDARASGRQRAFVHPSSLLFKESSYACPYVVFSERMVTQQANPQYPTRLSLSGCSEASVYALLLFGGALVVDHQNTCISVDGWIRFRGGSTTVVSMLQRLREAIDELLLRKVEEPSSQIGEDPVAQCVVTLLTTDGLGF